MDPRSIPLHTLACAAALASLWSCSSDDDDACAWLAAQLDACGQPMAEADVVACTASLEPCTKPENRALVAFFDCVAETSGAVFCGTATPGGYDAFVEAPATCADAELTDVSDACREASGYAP